MGPTPVSCSYTLTAENETIDVVDGPCVLKAVKFSTIETQAGITYLAIKDGSTELFRLYNGSYSYLAGAVVGAQIPGLGIRIESSLKFSTEASNTLKTISIFYQV